MKPFSTPEEIVIVELETTRQGQTTIQYRPFLQSTSCWGLAVDAKAVVQRLDVSGHPTGDFYLQRHLCGQPSDAFDTEEEALRVTRAFIAWEEAGAGKPKIRIREISTYQK